MIRNELQKLLSIVKIVFACSLWNSAICNTTKPREVLVFGGNGFLGSTTVQKFIANGDHVTIVNRGNWYWDTRWTIKPSVSWIKCDRSKALDTCSEWHSLTEKVAKWDVVIDFSAYGPFEVEEAVKELTGKVQLYIYISTDSVYEVCTKNHKQSTQEKDSVRPESEEERGKLNSFDGYGHRKLQGEEVLYKQRWQGGFPFIALRLTDVIGPRDSTNRFWIYQLWTKLSKMTDHPVVIPSFLKSYPLSLVYVNDVAELLFTVIKMGPQVYDQAVNLAFTETVTLEELIKEVASTLGIEDLPIIYKDQDENPMYLYPSVRRGPVDITKAENLLFWEPTSWKDAVRETVEFYEKALSDKNFALQRDEVVQAARQKVFFDKQKQFLLSLEEAYSVDFKHFKITLRDEL